MIVETVAKCLGNGRWSCIANTSVDQVTTVQDCLSPCFAAVDAVGCLVTDRGGDDAKLLGPNKTVALL